MSFMFHCLIITRNLLPTLVDMHALGTEQLEEGHSKALLLAEGEVELP